MRCEGGMPLDIVGEKYMAVIAVHLLVVPLVAVKSKFYRLRDSIKITIYFILMR